MKCNQHELILTYLRRHKWITPWSCASRCRSLKLSTRLGELRREGYEFKDKWIERNGKRFKAYALTR